MAREYKIGYRNFGIMAHIDAGKTTTTERTHCGQVVRDQRVDDNAVRGLNGAGAGARHHHHVGCDDDLLERSRRQDAPLQHHRHAGHIDFTIESNVRCVLDGAIALVDANAGVEPQTETVWRQADKYHVRAIFCNKMDKIGADFYRSVEMIKTRLGAQAVVMQLPIGAERNSRASSISSR
jgi:elongation factor G